MADRVPRRPRLRIGVSASLMHPDPKRNLFKGKMLLFVEESMLRMVMTVGAVPVLLPRPSGAVSVQDLVDEIDGLLLQGGADLSPRSYGEEPQRPEWQGDLLRDGYEMELVRACMATDRPVLGVCRGHQLLNVALGGSLYQDIETMHPAQRQHRNWEIYDGHAHDVIVEAGSQLSRWYGDGTQMVGRVNSVHHQGIKVLGRGLAVEARSTDDGIVEAVRYVGDADIGGTPPFAYGVQWHPEFMLDIPDATRAPWLDPRVLLTHFVEEVDRRRGPSSVGNAA